MPAEGLPQCRHIEVAFQLILHGINIRSRIGEQPAVMPDAFLAEGKRQGRWRDAAVSGAVRPWHGDSFGWLRSAARPLAARTAGARKIRVKDMPQTRKDLHGQQRMAADIKEVVVSTDGVHAQHIGPNVGNQFLDGAAAPRNRRLPLCWGLGSRCRSTLPLGVSGSASRITIAEGTM